MRAVVIGGGVVGMLSAYYLMRAGVKVAVVERQSESGMAASSANLNMLHYALITPPVSPDLLPRALGILAGRDKVIRLEDPWHPRTIAWLLRAMPLMLSRPHYDQSCMKLWEINQRSKALMDAFIADHPEIEFSHRRTGRLALFETQVEVEAAYGAYVKHGLEGHVRRVSREEAFGIEPCLAQKSGLFVGGLFLPDDEIGDCRAFVLGLEALLKRAGVAFHMGSEIRSFSREGGRVREVLTDHGAIEADVFVVAAGVWARDLLQPLGIHVPIYPVKGYTYEVAAEKAGGLAPKSCFTYTTQKLGFTPLKDSLKISSGAFFGNNYKSGPHEAFLAHMRARANDLYPGIDFEGARLHAGYRPWVPDSLPVVKRSRYDNLYLNVGHGMLGWTMAQATGKALADLVVERA